MARLTQAQAHDALSRYYQIVYEAADAGYKEYINSDHVGIHSPRSTAMNINDHIWAQLINRLEGVAGIDPVFDGPRGLRFMKIDAPRPILLWVKKDDPGRRQKLNPTDHAEKMLTEAQCELLPRAEILVLGYTPARDGLRLRRVSIHPPCAGNRSKPQWWIDIIEVPSTTIAVAGAAKVQIEVKRSIQGTLGL